MELDRDACYRAIQARDARFDGRLFTAVRTTGVYCRPICPARTPKLENVIFYPSAAAAQAAGFRPCLRCRPESSPELAVWHGTSTTVSRALALIADGALDGEDAAVDQLALRLGIGDRQLRRLFQKHLGASPIAVAQTRRVLFAKQLIHETRISMADVALASGFGSVRRFNDIFRRLYGRPPSALRREPHARVATAGRRSVRRPPEARARRSRATFVAPMSTAEVARPLRGRALPRFQRGSSGITLILSYAPPYDWPAMIAFLAARAIPGVEVVEPDRYRRTVAVDGEHGVIEVAPVAGRPALAATIHSPSVQALPAIVARIRRVFDLAADVGAINAQLRKDARLRPLVAARPGLRVPGAWDGFELAVRAILGQQITVTAARRLAGRLVAVHGEPLSRALPDSCASLTTVFPSPESLAGADLATLGLPRARARALSALAAAAADARLFHRDQDLDAAVARLKALPGIGEWTAQYIAMRVLREPDAFPAHDIGLLRAMTRRDGRRPTPTMLLAQAEAWRPWRAYAAQHLWTAGRVPADDMTDTPREAVA
jgi:AraC family transcriptional regulator of adaptative response / DNA-3-methyladenine glycosylase II